MRHLKKFAAIESLTARLLIAGAHIPVIIVMIVLHFLEGIVRAFHEVSVQMSVSLSAATQSLMSHNIEGVAAISRDMRELVKGPAKPEPAATCIPRLGLVHATTSNGRVAPRKWW